MKYEFANTGMVHGQYHGRWWFRSVRIQSISNHVYHLVIPEFSGFIITRVKSDYKQTGLELWLSTMYKDVIDFCFSWKYINIYSYSAYQESIGA